MEWQTAVIMIFAAAVLVAGITQYAFYQMTQMKALSHQQTFKAMEQVGLYSKHYFESLAKKEVQITSHDGLRLHGVVVEHESRSNRWVILVHGYTASLPASIPFMKIFQEQGFHTLLIDQRRHGKSEGKYTTFGFQEKHDIESWIQWIMGTYGTNSTIGLHGLSLGGGTVLEYLSLANPKAAFVIADCPYSDLTRLMHHQMQKLYRMPAAVFLPLVDNQLRRRVGFALKQVSPVRSVEGSLIPVMFIHGAQDRYIPTVMSEELFTAKPGKKRLLLIEGASHGNALGVNPKLYKESVHEFMQEVLAEEEALNPSEEPVPVEEWPVDAVSTDILQPELNI